MPGYVRNLCVLPDSFVPAVMPKDGKSRMRPVAGLRRSRHLLALSMIERRFEVAGQTVRHRSIGMLRSRPSA